jgi:diguanylate cyclase (GGDEF)-like protein
MFEKIYELRQSIDDLTRFAQTYVITKEDKYKQNYFKIIKIRNGEISKPDKYFSIYWDLLSQQREHRHPQQENNFFSLEQEMDELPYTEEEYMLIKESTLYTAKLLDLEKQAFKMIETNNSPKAIDLIFSTHYHEIKEKAMLPIDKFILSLEKRTTEKIKSYNTIAKNIYNNLYILIVLGLFITTLTFYLIFIKIINPIRNLTNSIVLYKKGHKNIEKFHFFKDEIGFLIKNFFDMKNKIDNDMIKLQELASIDSLTGLYNRKAFFEFCDEYFKIAKREKQNFSILLLDIDFFKKINDIYGHLVGDEVLKFVSNNIKSQIRQSDILARYGGEEFIVFLPKTDLEGAKNLAQKTNKFISTHPYVDQEIKLDITISIGIATYNQETKLLDVIKKADNALYKAKESGRNCVKYFIDQ